MPELVYSRHHTDGLTVAEYAADERAIGQLLKDYDPRLRLTWEIDSRSGRQVWNVVYVWSPEHPAQQVLTWRENGTGDPLPLTSRLVDEVKRLREVDTMKISNRQNNAVREQAAKHEYDETLEAVTDFKRIVDTGRIHVPHTVGNAKLVAAKRRGREQGRAT